MTVTNGYAPINGLQMYYEIHGQGSPLVLVHGGGSTIDTTFGRVIPLLAQHRQVIAVELQAHGRTSDRDADERFDQDADDVAALLQHLGIAKADVFGFSNGATTTIQLAVRHPAVLSKIVLGSALCKRHGVVPGFWDFMSHASLEQMPAALQQAYLQVSPNPTGLQVMHDRDVKRMVNFEDIPDEYLRSITAPALVINGDKEVITTEHALEISRLIPHAQLAIIPGGHGEYIGEITTLKPGFQLETLVVPLIENFLDKA